jgi:hypothetical protein
VSRRPKLVPQAPRRDVKRLLDLNGLQLRYSAYFTEDPNRCVVITYFPLRKLRFIANAACLHVTQCMRALAPRFITSISRSGTIPLMMELASWRWVQA